MYRGIVADRINRIRMAEKAYRKVIAKGYSVYAWNRLLDIYVTANNMHAAFSCIWDVFEYFTDILKVSHYRAPPVWIENAVYRLVSKNGLKAVKTTVMKEKMKKLKVLDDCLIKAEEDRIYGSLF